MADSQTVGLEADGDARQTESASALKIIRLHRRIARRLKSNALRIAARQMLEKWCCLGDLNT